MKIEELRKIIHEEVVKALREEIRDILTEAVEIASRPDKDKVVVLPLKTERPVKKSNTFSENAIGDILQETARTMTRDDYSIMSCPSVPQENGSQLLESKIDSEAVGLPDFVKRAKAVLDASNLVDKERHAV